MPTLYGFLILLLHSISFGWSFSLPPWTIGRATPAVTSSCRAYNPNYSRFSTNASWETDDDDYYNDEEEEEAEPKPKAASPPFRDDLEWESLSVPDAGTVHILLPTTTSQQPPSCIVHFVGGTLVGSAPVTWYRTLLEDTCRHTRAAMVVTTVPLTKERPLHHVSLARRVQRQFQVAMEEVLVPEYGQHRLVQVPVCGMGHSLGARLLTVLATLESSSASKQRLGGGRGSYYNYKAFILISFTNCGAAAGIPGIRQLRKSSRRVERDVDTTTRTKQRQDNDEWSNNSNSRSRRMIDDDEYDDDDDDDDDDWSAIFQDVQDSMRQQVVRVQSALTPRSADLEFHPSPEQLWKALSSSSQPDRSSRYSIPHTLLVQFDQDDVDESAALARAIGPRGSVFFARLRGTHWTPISLLRLGSSSSSSSSSSSGWFNDDSDQTKVIYNKDDMPMGRQLLEKFLYVGRSKDHDAQFRDLRQTIARYITEVVTQP
jgi:hypothetical protein